DLYLHEDDVLWAAVSDGILRMPPGTDEWVVVQDDRSSNAIVVTEAGVLLRVRGSSVQRSTDGGETFEVVYPDAVFQSPLYRVWGGPFSGRILIGTAREIGQTVISRPGAAFSDDDGLTWTDGDIGPEGEPFGHPSVYFS